MIERLGLLGALGSGRILLFFKINKMSIGYSKVRKLEVKLQMV